MAEKSFNKAFRETVEKEVENVIQNPSHYFTPLPFGDIDNQTILAFIHGYFSATTKRKLNQFDLSEERREELHELVTEIIKEHKKQIIKAYK